VQTEAGSAAAFTSARALYAEAGFVECERFGDDPAGPERCLIKLRLGRA